MSFFKIFVIIAVLLFGTIGVIAIVKKVEKSSTTKVVQVKKAKEKKAAPPAPVKTEAPKATLPLAEVDRIQELFEIPARFPLVETISYKSRVPWLSGRAAWIADYASHFGTSRHFIARSLNRKVDYLTQKVAEGDTFNVFRRDKNISFRLLIDLSHCKMLFYIMDEDTKEKTLLKTYSVGLGRIDPKSPSGSLTPLGGYSLGSKIAIYKPGTMGLFHGETQEMIRIFGARWIPFEKELEGATAPAKGLGIHGAPWVLGKDGTLAEDTSSLMKYESDGCIRLATADMEELFAIIITKPAICEIVKSVEAKP